MTKEKWRGVVGFKYYEVSNHGRVRSLDRVVKLHRKDGKIVKQKLTGKIMKLSRTKRGYVHVGLSKNGKVTNKEVHTLVAEAFIGLRPLGKEVRHLDNDGTHNNVSNLCYGTPLENGDDRRKNGKLRGENNPRSVLTEKKVAFIRKHYKFRDKKYNMVALANRFGVGVGAIHLVVSGQRW